MKPDAALQGRQALNFASGRDHDGRPQENLAQTVREQCCIGRISAATTQAILEPPIHSLSEAPALPHRLCSTRGIPVKPEALYREPGFLQGLPKQRPVESAEVHKSVRTSKMGRVGQQVLAV